MTTAETGRPIRWGVMGTARIATKVAAAIRNAANAELSAIASRSIDKAVAWGNEHQAATHYRSYAELLDDPEIDAVYIPLPPSMHAEWTIAAVERGKHILCEKPTAMNSQEVEQMIAACAANNVQLMDGVMWVHHPRTADMRQALTAGELGTLRRVTSAFSFHWDVVPEDDLRLDRALGGGSMLDLGWYNIRATLWAFAEMPKRVWGTAEWYRDVDMSFSGTMWFDDNRMASFDCAFNTGMRKWFEVAGTTGSLVCDDFVHPWKAEKPRFWRNGTSGESDERISEPAIQETRMIENFSRILAPLTDVAQIVYIDHRGSGRSATGDPESHTLENNIDDLDALREHLGLERVAILGVSYGGMVAQGYAIRYPERVSNLILCVTAPSYRFLDEAQQILNERGTLEQIAICEHLWNASFTSSEQLYDYYRLMGPLYSVRFDPEKFEENWGQSIRNFEQLNYGFGSFLKTFDYTEDLSKIICPTLVIAGARDWICPPAQSEIIAERIPRAHLKIFPNSSHAVSTDERAAFLAAVRGFLTYAPL
eukprot:g26641.t1